jgi:TPR repeat protein
MVARIESERQFYNLGSMIYNNANDNPEEVQKALFLWRKAMKMGSVAAKYSVAMCLKNGVGMKERDIKTAVKYFSEVLTPALHRFCGELFLLCILL